MHQTWGNVGQVIISLCYMFFLPNISVMCHMTFADESALIAHYDTAHAPSRGRQHSLRLECEFSGTKFGDLSSKRRHLRSASATCDVKMLQCDLCLSFFMNHVNVRHPGTQTP